MMTALMGAVFFALMGFGMRYAEDSQVGYTHDTSMWIFGIAALLGYYALLTAWVMHRSVLRVEAHAKINLTLEVLGKRPDGYHDLRSVVVPVPLHDDITLTLDDDVTVVMPGDVPQEKNLAWKAAMVLKRATKCAKGVRIEIVKRIPCGAGLGGGSSDAAAVLNALNKLWKLYLPVERLCELAAEVGSDVPALTMGGAVLMEGRGEKVTPLAQSDKKDFPLPDMSRLVLRTPEVFVSTPSVFKECREEDRGKGANDLQCAACRLHPEIVKAMDELKAEGCEGVMMSGSGSSVFGFKHV